MTDYRDSKVALCRIIPLETIAHERGFITVAQNDDSLPFAIRRLYYLYDVPFDSERGGHAHIESESLLVALSGCFDVTLDDGKEKRIFTLRRPNEALYVPVGLWRTIGDFSAGSVLLSLSSTLYEEADYIRDYDRFLSIKRT